MKAILGMSGGVDSSTCAGLLRDGGYGVEGLNIRLFESRGRDGGSSCCSLEALEDARDSARSAGIPLTVLDARDLFVKRVIEPFIEAYAHGVTPNPCILCNRFIKFPLLLEHAIKTGASHIATGHYARVLRNGGNSELHMGIDSAKDQSYVLYGLRREELERLVLPLGELEKTEVREIARGLGLSSATRPESQEICFVPDNDYAGLIKDLRPEALEPGDIVDAEGRRLGRHGGIVRYTIGQRKGLGISWPTPLYVTGINPRLNTVIVGGRDATFRTSFTVNDLNWLAAPPHEPIEAQVKVRSMMKPRAATITPSGSTIHVRFHEPEFAPTPGQAAVFYDGSHVLGGGTIVAVED